MNSEDLTLNPSSRVQVVKLVVVLGCLCPPPPKSMPHSCWRDVFASDTTRIFTHASRLDSRRSELIVPHVVSDLYSFWWCLLASFISAGWLFDLFKVQCFIMANHTLENALCACVRVSLECSIDGLMILHWWEISLEPHLICDIFLDHLCRTELSSSQKNLLKNPPFYPLHHREAGLTPATNMIKFSLIHQSWSCD